MTFVYGVYLSLSLVANPCHLLWLGLFTAVTIKEVINLVMKRRIVHFF